MEVLYLDCKNPFRLCLATRVLLEMDADWWKNDAAKVNQMESAAVKHEIESNFGSKKLQWKSAMEII